MQTYLITTFRTPAFDPEAITPHYAFLDALRQQGRLELADPFSDVSGGAYVIRAADLDEARSIAFGDPLHVTQSSVVTVYEWHAK